MRVINILILFFGVVGCAFYAQADISQAKLQYDKENYEEALVILAQLKDQPGLNALYGLTYFELQNFTKVIQYLRRDANDKDVLYALGMSYFSVDDSDAAEEVAKRLLSIDSSASSFYLSARIQHRNKGNAEKNYLRAYEKSDDYNKQKIAIDFVEYYYENGEVEKARRLIDKASRLDNNSFEAEYLLGLRKLNRVEQQDKRPWVIKLGVQFEYDDNVALVPNKGVLSVDEDSDIRGVANFQAEYRQKSETLSWQVKSNLYHSLHNEFSEFNETRQNYNFTLQWGMRNWGIILPIDINWDHLDGEQFLLSESITPLLYYKINPQNIISSFVKFQKNDFDEAVFLTDEVRSGTEFGVGFHWLSAIKKNIFLKTMVAHNRNQTDGRNWENDSIGYLISIDFIANKQLNIEIGYRGEQQDYKNIHEVVLLKRDDDINLYFATLNYQYNKQIAFTGQLTYIDNQSNISIYSYDRNFIITGLQWQF